MKLSDYSITLWLTDNQLKTEDGKDYDLKDHLFWFDILEDWSPKQVWYKAAQVGGTIAAVLKMIYAVNRFGINAIYTMPSASDVQTLVKGKVNRMVANNPCMQGMVKGDTISEKEIGKNMAYFRGAFKDQQAISVTSDLNIHDEVDRSAQNIVEMYASRLDNSEHAWQWWFSNPSMLGNGVATKWSKSDQKEWFITCKGCKKEQYLKWPDSICMQRKVYQCRYCEKELTNEERRVGRWVKKVLDAEWSGYHISQMMNLRKSAKDIIDAFENKATDYFYNFVLGLPYVGEGNRLEKDMFMRNVDRFEADTDSLVFGVDSGNLRHWVVGNRHGLLGYGIADSIDEVGRLLIKHPNSIMVIDNAPDITGPQILQEKFPNRVFRATFSQDRKSMELIRWGTNKERGAVLIDRNRAIQYLVDEFGMQKIPVQGTKQDWEKYYSHWDVMYRVQDVDSRGNARIKWESSTNMDHWALATVYWRAGMTRGSGGVSPIGDTMKIGATKALNTIHDGIGEIKPSKPKHDWRIS